MLGPSIENIENIHKNSGPLAEQKLLSMFTYAYILKYLHSCNSYNNNIGKALGEEFENVEKKALVLINLGIVFLNLFISNYLFIGFHVQKLKKNYI